jgi:hypothetical protein
MCGKSVPHVASSMSHQMVTKLPQLAHIIPAMAAEMVHIIENYVLHAKMKLHEAVMMDANNDAYVAQ